MNDPRPAAAALTFRASLLLAGKTATGIVVPDEVVAALGAGKRAPVHVTIGGYTYRSTVAVMRGRFMLPVSAEVRQAAGVAAGDELEIKLVLDSEPRVVAVPADFAAALGADEHAKARFDALSYSNQRGFVDGITGAKTPETRERRIAKAIDKLREGQA